VVLDRGIIARRTFACGWGSSCGRVRESGAGWLAGAGRQAEAGH